MKANWVPSIQDPLLLYHSMKPVKDAKGVYSVDLEALAQECVESDSDDELGIFYYDDIYATEQEPALVFDGILSLHVDDFFV